MWEANERIVFAWFRVGGMEVAVGGDGGLVLCAGAWGTVDEAIEASEVGERGCGVDREGIAVDEGDREG